MPILTVGIVANPCRFLIWGNHHANQADTWRYTLRHTLYNLSNPAHIPMIMLHPLLDPLPPTRAPTRPSKTLMQGFEYIPAAKTDIRRSWVKAGWIPIERKAPNDQAPNDLLELQRLNQATRAKNTEQPERRRSNPEANDWPRAHDDRGLEKICLA